MAQTSTAMTDDELSLGLGMLLATWPKEVLPPTTEGEVPF